jgi:hypothetical protein
LWIRESRIPVLGISLFSSAKWGFIKEFCRVFPQIILLLWRAQSCEAMYGWMAIVKSHHTSLGRMKFAARKWVLATGFAWKIGVGILVQLLQRTVRGLAHHSGDAGIRAANCNGKFALRPDSSVVERGPEKAGVGGSIPSLATTPSFVPLRHRPQIQLNPLFCYYLRSLAFALVR